MWRSLMKSPRKSVGRSPARKTQSPTRSAGEYLPTGCGMSAGSRTPAVGRARLHRDQVGLDVRPERQELAHAHPRRGRARLGDELVEDARVVDDREAGRRAALLELLERRVRGREPLVDAHDVAPQVAARGLERRRQAPHHVAGLALESVAEVRALRIDRDLGRHAALRIGGVVPGDEDPAAGLDRRLHSRRPRATPPARRRPARRSEWPRPLLVAPAPPSLPRSCPDRSVVE